MKRLFIYVIGIIVLVCILLIQVRAAEQNVTFNGNFANGTTPYSSATYFNHVSITAKDAYPIRNCTTTLIRTVCKEYNYTYVKVCLNSRVNTENCSRWKRERVLIGCKRYFNVTITRCTSLKALCINPFASNTNQLSLTNFAYSPDNGTGWYTVPYKKLELNNVNLIFRVNIPSLCYPVYDIEKAIKLEY